MASGPLTTRKRSRYPLFELSAHLFFLIRVLVPVVAQSRVGLPSPFNEVSLQKVVIALREEESA